MVMNGLGRGLYSVNDFFEFLKLHGLKLLSCAMMEYQFEFAHQT